MTGRRNRAQAAAKFGKRCLPNWFLPPRPRRSFPQGISHRESRYLARSRGKYFLRLAFYMDQKNWIQRISNFSEQPRGSVRTSFGCRSICLPKDFACSFDFLKRRQPRKQGRRGRETRLFAKRKCRALLVYKQSYGCFEMVSPPRERLILKFISIAKNLSFICSSFLLIKSDIVSHRL